MEGRNAIEVFKEKDVNDLGLILYSLSKHYFFNSLDEN
jgi:hypothetical protein